MKYYLAPVCEVTDEEGNTSLKVAKMVGEMECEAADPPSHGPRYQDNHDPILQTVIVSQHDDDEPQMGWEELLPAVGLALTGRI